MEESIDEVYKRICNEKDDLMELSLNLTLARMNAGLSVEDLANNSRLTPVMISRIENGVDCKISTYIKYVRALNLKFNVK